MREYSSIFAHFVLFNPYHRRTIMTRSEFRALAEDLAITIAGVPHTAEVKEFSTRSLGWFLNGKTKVKVGNEEVRVQIGLNLTIIGSKEFAENPTPPATSTSVAA
jgi:hypothetical protein